MAKQTTPAPGAHHAAMDQIARRDIRHHPTFSAFGTDLANSNSAEANRLATKFGDSFDAARDPLMRYAHSRAAAASRAAKADDSKAASGLAQGVASTAATAGGVALFQSGLRQVKAGQADAMFGRNVGSASLLARGRTGIMLGLAKGVAGVALGSAGAVAGLNLMAHKAAADEGKSAPASPQTYPKNEMVSPVLASAGLATLGVGAAQMISGTAKFLATGRFKPAAASLVGGFVSSMVGTAAIASSMKPAQQADGAFMSADAQKRAATESAPRAQQGPAQIAGPADRSSYTTKDGRTVEATESQARAWRGRRND